MTDEELREVLIRLYAYDSGDTDSGLHDELLRSRCIAELRSRAEAASHDQRNPAGPTRDAAQQHRFWLSRLLRDMWLSEDALAQGYGIEDLVEFVRWLDERMDFAI